METHARKKVEIVVERARAPAIIERIEALGATGHTVIPDVQGSGRHGPRGRSEVLDVYRSALIIVITTEPMARRILDEVHGLLRNYTGIVYMSDVEVLRPEHF
jgi:PII-like signaling protein